jgi:hypothetical protein
MVYKSPLPFKQGVPDPFPPSPRELPELSAHPFVTPVHLQYQAAGCMAITSKPLHSSQDHLRTRMRDLDHPGLTGAENIDNISIHV